MKKARQDKSDHALAYYQMIWSRNLVDKIGFDSFVKAQQFAINQSIDFMDTNLMLSAIGNLSAMYLYKGEHDSGLKYSKIGYDISVNASIDRYIFFYSINMGYVMNGDQLYGAAQIYFEQALKVSKRLFPRNNVLLNNLFSVMITEKITIKLKPFGKKILPIINWT